jgi:hypothetical protein
MLDRKAMLRQYKETPRAAGLFAVRNTADGGLLVGVSTDLPAMLNRQRFQLQTGMHADKALQADWDRVGPDAFSFEVLDGLERAEGADSDLRDDLRTLHGMWVARLASAGLALYPSSTKSS